MPDHRRRRKIAGVVGAGLLALSFIAAGQTVAPRPDERHDLTVRLVLVDAVAFGRDGRFLADLAKADFEVYEDGKKMDLASADLVRHARDGAGPGAAPAAAPVPAASPRPARESRFVVVFDSINTIKRMLEREKPEILARLLELLDVGREIIVFELAEDGRMALLQPLTRDRHLVAKAVEKATGSIWVEKAADALIVPSIVGGGETSIRVDGYEALRGRDQHGQAVMEAESRRRFERTVNGLLGVMNIVKDFEGRKSLLFVSGGVPALSFVRFFEGGGIEDSTAVQSQIAAAKVNDPFKSLGKSGIRTGSEIFDDLVRFANSHNISFYTLDPDNYLRYVLGDIAHDNFPRVIGRSPFGTAGIGRPDEIAEFKRSELASLRALADDTGGAAFLGGDKFEAFAGTIERDFAQYYELSYTPKRKRPDGKYHKIQVKVLRPGADVRFRQGFLDYTDEQRESLAFASAAYSPSLFKDIPFEARIVPFAKGRDKFVLWIQTALSARRILGDGAPADETVLLKFKLTLDDPSGESGFQTDVAVPIVLIPSFLQRVRNADYFGWSVASGETELKPRTYRATFAIYDRKQERMGTVEGGLEIPKLEAGDGATLLTTAVGKIVETDKALVTPFALASDDGTFEVPNRKFYPMAVAHVPRGQRAGLFVQIHSTRDPRKMALGVSAAREGGAAEAAPLPAVVVHQEWSRKTGIWNVLYELDLETLPPGDHGLAFRWEGGPGFAPVESALSFRIL